jgi:thiamine biosynthesis lipoprotein
LRSFLFAAGFTAGLCAFACKRQPDAPSAEPRAGADATAPVPPRATSASASPPPSIVRTPFEPKEFQAKSVAMGTHVTFIAFTTEAVDEASMRSLFAKALEEIRRLEALLSEWREDSDIGRVNRSNGAWVEVRPETLEVLQKGIATGKLSDGTFDITFQALSGLWKFGDAREADPRVPKRADVLAQKRLVDYRKVELDGAKVRRVLKDGGLHAFLVQAGGDLYGAGRKPDGSHWVSGVTDPRGGHDKYFGVLELEDHAFSTAGDYARSYIVEGKRYHHIIDPRTGYPATACRSVTIWAPDALTADTIDDAVFILGPEKGLKLVESLEGVGAVIVDASNKVWVSKRLEGKWKQLSAPTDGL